MGNKNEAKRLFRVHTNNTGQIDYLYGPSQATRRAHILSALEGKNVPKSKAGWNVFRRAMIELYGVEGNCIAIRDRNLQAAARQ